MTRVVGWREGYMADPQPVRFAPSTAGMLALGGFLMQFAAQGAWGVVPVHINELAPDGVRGTFPGFAYQAGNIIASVNGTLQAGLAERSGYPVALALCVFLGPERKGAALR